MTLLLWACHTPDESAPNRPPPNDSSATRQIYQFEETSRDTTTYAEVGYIGSTWNLAPGNRNPYRDAQGFLPTFDLYYPADTQGKEVPLVIWYHGGAFGNDANGNVPAGCGRDDISGMMNGAVGTISLVIPWFAERGWALAMPRNGWCDLWVGQGENDPVDTSHLGYTHVERVISFLQAGGAGFQTSALYGWGTSMGSTAAISVAARHGGFDGIIADSPPCVLSELWTEASDALVHIFGGSPTDPESAPRYRQASCDALVEDHVFKNPVFVPWNTMDQMVEPVHPTTLIAALEANFPSEGLIFNSHDFDHAYPQPQQHVQSRLSVPPGGVITDILMDFLEGKTVIWVEAEAEDGMCGAQKCVGSNKGGLATDSQSAAREVQRQVMGEVYRERVPNLVAGQPVEAVLMLDLWDASKHEPDAEVITVSYSDASGAATSATFTNGLFYDALDGQAPTVATNLQMLRQFNATRLQFTPGDPSTGEISVSSTGIAGFDLDAIAYLY